MKQLYLIGLFAVALLLGTGCKKEQDQLQLPQSNQVEAKKSPDAKPNISSTFQPQTTKPSFVGYDATVYPHFTGLCACAQCVWLIHHYSSCDGYKYFAGGDMATPCDGCKSRYVD